MIVHIVFKSADKWFEEHKDLKSKFEKTNKSLFTTANGFAAKLDKKVYDTLSEHAEIKISEILLRQALIDAFDDLIRLTNYHPTKEPNPIKEMSYIAYWLVRHKPISLLKMKI